jgi:hypothetical protein
MRNVGSYLVLTSSGLFILYFANVVAGSLAGQVFLSDVGEMLTLFAACIVFVIGILHLEKRAALLSAKSQNG